MSQKECYVHPFDCEEAAELTPEFLAHLREEADYVMELEMKKDMELEMKAREADGEGKGPRSLGEGEGEGPREADGEGKGPREGEHSAEVAEAPPAVSTNKNPAIVASTCPTYKIMQILGDP